jgi:hypothetical protein
MLQSKDTYTLHQDGKSCLSNSKKPSLDARSSMMSSSTMGQESPAAIADDDDDGNEYDFLRDNTLFRSSESRELGR